MGLVLRRLVKRAIKLHWIVLLIALWFVARLHNTALSTSEVARRSDSTLVVPTTTTRHVDSDEPITGHHQAVVPVTTIYDDSVRTGNPSSRRKAFSIPIPGGHRPSPPPPPPPRIIFFIPLYTATGGPEAMLQCALAFSKFHNETYRMSTQRSVRSYYIKEYPQMLLELHTWPSGLQGLKAGDVLILPEIMECPKQIISDRKVQVYLYLLSTRFNKTKVQDSPCDVISHNYWIGDYMNTTNMLRPYLTPSMVQKSVEVATRNSGVDDNVGFLEKKERLILVNYDYFDPMNSTVLRGLKEACLEWNCELVLVHGFTKDELIDLYQRAMIVFAECLEGSERVLLEASLFGAILVTADCQCGKDVRDFPIPDRNLLKLRYNNVFRTFGGLDRKLLLFKRILDNYEEEHRDNEPIRTLYSQSVGPTSLEHDARTMFDVFRRKQLELV